MTRFHFTRTRQADKSDSIASSTDRRRSRRTTREYNKKETTKPLPTGSGPGAVEATKGKELGAVANISSGKFSRVHDWRFVFAGGPWGPRKGCMGEKVGR